MVDSHCFFFGCLPKHVSCPPEPRAFDILSSVQDSPTSHISSSPVLRLVPLPQDRAEGLEHNWLIKLSDNVTRDDIEQMCSEASNANVTFTQKARAMGMHMHAARARAQAADEAPGVDWSKRQSAQSVRRFGKECVRRASRMGVLNVVARDDVHLQEIRNVWSDSIEYIEPNYKVSFAPKRGRAGSGGDGRGGFEGSRV